MHEITEMNITGTSRAVLYTPRTPREPGRRRYSIGVFEESHVDSFLELLNQTWTIFGVSALFGFVQDSEVHLKQYAKRLREEIANTLTRENVTYDATFSVINNLNRTSTDPSAIKVEVFAKANTAGEETTKSIYKGMFISWRTVQDEPITNKSIKLPLLLCRGTRSCMNAVHATISRMFDCIIISLDAEEDDLKWLLPIVITPNSKEEQLSNNDEIRMEYIVPGLPLTDTIIIKFRVSDLVKVLDIVGDNENGTEVNIMLEAEQIEKFHDVLHTQILQLSGLQLGLCSLYRLTLPVFTIMNNKMKVMNSETMSRVLLYLNGKALEALHRVQIHV